jgi:glutathione S-transferase
MDADYTLYYWPIPFRGQFIRAVLVHVGATWEEADIPEIMGLKIADPVDQPVPFMAPPMLVDRVGGEGIAQLPAILTYLGEKYELIPDSPLGRALTQQIIGNANDILDELTRSGGAQMWTLGEWETWIETRMPRWMQIFEETAHRFEMSLSGGSILGTKDIGLADLVSATLWGVLGQKLPFFAKMLDENAPMIAAHTKRINASEGLVALREQTDAAFGTVYCSGDIEQSIRDMIAKGTTT